MNSRSATATPARRPIAIPSPVDNDGVGGDGEALAGAAGGEDGVGGPQLVVGAGRVDRPHPHRPSVDDEEVEGEPPLVDVGGRVPHRVDQRPLDLGAGGVAARMHDPGHRVAALPGVGEVGVRPAVELGAEPDQLPDPGRPFGDENVHRVDVAEAGAGRDGVGEVQGGRVDVGFERGGDTALRVLGRGPGQLTLR